MKKEKPAKSTKRLVSFYKYTKSDKHLLITRDKPLKDTYQQKITTLKKVYNTPSSEVVYYYIDDDQDLFDTNIYLKFELIHDTIIITIAEHLVFDILEKIAKFLENKNISSIIEDSAIYISTNKDLFTNELIHKKICIYVYSEAIKDIM